jgi:hypothetical protein
MVGFFETVYMYLFTKHLQFWQQLITTKSNHALKMRELIPKYRIWEGLAWVGRVCAN